MPGTYDPIVREIWVNDLPGLAMKHSPLFASIMALSILYLSLTGQMETLKTGQSALEYRPEYIASAIEGHRRALSSLSKETGDASSLTCAVLAVDGLASMRNRSLRPYEPPTAWLRLCQGAAGISAMARGLLINDEKSKINLIAESVSSFVNAEAVMQESNWKRFQYIFEGVKSVSNFEAYRTTLSWIGAILSGRDNGDDMQITRRKVVIYPMLFPTRFGDLVHDYDPRALVILAHYFGAASICGDDIWWLGDAPRMEILAISELLGPEWTSFMQWPLEMVRLHSNTRDTQVE